MSPDLVEGIARSLKETLSMSVLAPSTEKTYAGYCSQYANFLHEYTTVDEVDPDKVNDIFLASFLNNYVKRRGNKPQSAEIAKYAVINRWKGQLGVCFLAPLVWTNATMARLKRWWKTEPLPALVLSGADEETVWKLLLERCSEVSLSEPQRAEWLAICLSWLFAFLAHRGGDFLPSSQQMLSRHLLHASPSPHTAHCTHQQPQLSRHGRESQRWS